MKKVILSTTLSLLTFGIMADFPTDFQNARNLYNQRKWEDAAASFVKIAETAPATAKDQCYSYAARAQAQQRKQVEAEASAGKIKNPGWRNYTLMTILVSQGKTKELIEKFQSEKIETWPEEIAYLGFYLRGNAMGYNQALSKEAIADLEKSLAQCGSDELTKILVLNALVRTARTAGDTAKALAAADQVLAMKNFKGFYAYLDSAMLKNQILISEKKFDEAQKSLDALNAERKWNGGPWQLVYLENCGDLALAKGNAAEAGTYYRQALEIKEVHPGHLSRVKGKLDKIK